MNKLSGVVSGLGMVIALADMQAQERAMLTRTPTPQANRSTNLNSSRSNRTVEPTPKSEEERTKGDISKSSIQNIKARSGQPSPSPTPDGRMAATITPTAGPQDATNLNSSRSNRQAQPTPTAPPR